MTDNQERQPLHPDLLELLHHDQYSPEDAAYLLGMDPDVILQAAHRHDLPAVFAGHDVLYIRRSDLVRWLETR